MSLQRDDPRQSCEGHAQKAMGGGASPGTPPESREVGRSLWRRLRPFPGAERRPSGLEPGQWGVWYRRAGGGWGVKLVGRVKDAAPPSYEQESTFKEAV